MSNQERVRIEPYDPKTIESHWSQRWQEDEIYRSKIDRSRPKHYALTMLPYPSGDLHIGHWYAMVPPDARARLKRMQGYNVLFPMGFDAFGLPAENAAIKRRIHPQEWTYANIARMKQQMYSMGTMFDWQREAVSSDPEYYRWTQWFFLKYYENDLAYKKLAAVDFCPNCNTTLAREQVIGEERLCERCDTPVIRKELDQWFFRITNYAEELLDYEGIRWPERVRTMQENWIGKSEGAYVTFYTKDEDEIEIFTTRPDTLWGATFMVLSPEHPLVAKLTTDSQRAAVTAYVETAARKTEIDRTAEGKEKTGVWTGGYAINPVNDERIPVWIADYVLMNYGTGAIMAVPAHDQRDFEFARQYGLEVRPVIQPEGAVLDGATMPEAWAGEGYMLNSGTFDGAYSNNEKGDKNPAIKAVVAWLEEKNFGVKGTTYRLRDWLISRQRYWGAPIPIIYCPTCGTVPVPYEDLPVILPSDVDFMPTGESPLKFHTGFLNTTCPKCGGAAKRETDTMDTFMCSSWYQYRYLSPDYTEGPFDPQEAAYWLPVDQYTGGIEHATMHLLYTRYFTKAMRDCGIFEPVIEVLRDKRSTHTEIQNRFNEPMLALFNQGIILGEPRDGHFVIVSGEWHESHLLASMVTVVGSPEDFGNGSGVAHISGEVVKRTENILIVEDADGNEVVVNTTPDTVFEIPGFGPNGGIDQIKYRLDVEKMSKSKGNVAAPDELVEKYGADTVRAYLMFAFRWEKGGPWDSQGIQGVVRWLNDVWDVVNTGAPVSSGDTESADRALRRKLHQTIKKVGDGIEDFSFNTAVAGLMEMKNALQKATNVSAEVWQEAARTMLILMAPITPFITEALWERIGGVYSIHQQPWPTYDPAAAAEEEITLVIQINGKVRDRITAPVDISEEEAKALALASPHVQRFLEGKPPQKVIYVSQRGMVSIVV